MVFHNFCSIVYLWFISTVAFFFRVWEGVVLRWWRSKTGRPLSPPQIHQKIWILNNIQIQIWILNNFHKTISVCWRRTPGTQKGSPFSLKGGHLYLLPPSSLLCLTLLSLFLCFIFCPTSFRRGWAAFLGAWCPPPALRSCFVEVARHSNDLPMNLWERKWSPCPIPLPSWDHPQTSLLSIDGKQISNDFQLRIDLNLIIMNA